ncbi:MAG TPA: PRC-barrel domain-containing protein [Geminicoccaceae bacterium]|nr:PRC-barrel domain-containing protein [Geminicoccaceae bacterium]
MRKTLLATVGAAVLTFAGAAAAQQVQPGGPADPKFVPNVGVAETSTGAPRGSISPGGAASGRNLEVDPELAAQAQASPRVAAMPAAGEAAAGTGAELQGYRSYARLGDGAGVTIGGGFEADDLRQARIVDRDGEQVGQVADLLVDEQGRAEWALITPSDEPQRHVAVRVDDLQRGEGDASDELVLDRGRDELRGMSAYEWRGERWTPSS